MDGFVGWANVWQLKISNQDIPESSCMWTSNKYSIRDVRSTCSSNFPISREPFLDTHPEHLAFLCNRSDTENAVLHCQQNHSNRASSIVPPASAHAEPGPKTVSTSCSQVLQGDAQQKRMPFTALPKSAFVSVPFAGAVWARPSSLLQVTWPARPAHTPRFEGPGSRWRHPRDAFISEETCLRHRVGVENASQ